MLAAHDKCFKIVHAFCSSDKLYNIYMNSKSSVYNNKKISAKVKVLIYYDICWVPYYISQLKKNNDYV